MVEVSGVAPRRAYMRVASIAVSPFRQDSEEHQGHAARRFRDPAGVW